jgi:Spy/CpxP family protein refolding chaperone
MKLTIARFATVAAMAAGMAIAQTPAPTAGQDQPRAGKRMAKQAMRGRMARALNLTPAQKEQAKAIHQQARQKAQPLAKQLKANREALAAAVKANDVAQIHSLSAQRGNLQGQLLGIRSEARAKVYATLTPEQKAKADQIRERVGERMKQRFEKRKAARG